MFTQSDREMLRASCTNRGGILPWYTAQENDSLKDQIKIYEKLMALIFNSDTTKASDILIHDGEVYRLDSYIIQGGNGEAKTLTGVFTYVGEVK